MIRDIQLAMFANLLGIVLFLLVVLYHFIQVRCNNCNHYCWVENFHVDRSTTSSYTMSNFNVWGYLARWGFQAPFRETISLQSARAILWNWLRMGVEVRGPGQDGVEEGDQVAGVNTPIILRWGMSVALVIFLSYDFEMPLTIPELKTWRSCYTGTSSNSVVRSVEKM